MDATIVIPVYNEEENLPILAKELHQVLAGSGLDYEIIFVDDGSTDGTAEGLLALEEADSRVRVVQLRRNFGQTAAFSAGFDRAEGEIVVTSDGDLQNDPADIPELVRVLESGHDIVAGWRRSRRRRRRRAMHAERRSAS